MADQESTREGSLEAPTRHPINWHDPDFYNETSLFAELERVFDICHGCRRCFSLCHSFPSLFDMIDESESMELDGVEKADYWKVVDHCYLCDMCYMTKCPYVPPHPWNLDFPHLMLRAKAVKFKQGKFTARDKLLTSTDLLGKLAGIPVVSAAVNGANKNPTVRRVVQNVLGVHADAHLPEFAPHTLKQRQGKHVSAHTQIQASEGTRGKVALFGTCYGSYNEPQLGDDLVAIFEHNAIPVTLATNAQCCGMPKLELGDLQTVEQLKNVNIPILTKLVDEGWDIVAPVPSCVFMFKSELPLMFPDDAQVAKVSAAMFDPFEYLMLRYKAGLLRTDFKTPLGSVTHHAPCHLRSQNIGVKTREVLSLVPDTQVKTLERCAGHNGTYGVKVETYEMSMKIGKPVFKQVQDAAAAHYASDCPMAGHHIEHGMDNHSLKPEHPLSLLRLAYGI
ncbi:MAG: Fe-S oxidoreductase [Gammaproteobacteria bacterium]|nr:Fe-S oxidoreductase [Gammaproteobacteria bacterium]MCP5458786.1 Fe-S oxidoreductase [Gammaproteobacteria bacterium]